MRLLTTALCLLISGTNVLAAIKTQTVEYKHGDTVLEGYLAYDDATQERRPAVIVVHEWWGNNEYSRKRAEMVAQLGYVGFAIDMYGKGKTTTEVAKATEWSGQFKADPKMAMSRAQAGLDTLKAQPMVDTNRIASIGYCFGGAISLHMARNNFPLLGVVSFHGDLTGGATPPQNIMPKILVLHGAADPFVPPPVVAAFIEEMDKANANWELVYYSKAVHTFTNPNAEKAGLNGVAYNEQADKRSWEAMKDFLSELFGR